MSCMVHAKRFLRVLQHIFLSLAIGQSVVMMANAVNVTFAEVEKRVCGVLSENE